MPRPGRAPPAPFVAPIDGDINQRLAIVAGAINRKADAVSTPTFASIQLVSPDGSTWMVSVSDTGVLTTTVMPR